MIDLPPAGDEPSPIFRAGRRRNACFLTGGPRGVLIEVTELQTSR